ncbi:MAG: right-handed parallel beta-helix repeat-containing protein [Candidatus Woesearchaeota archaeon]
MKKLILIILTLFFLNITIVCADTIQNIDSCRNLTESNTTYLINTSINSSDISCFIIRDTNITLDCNNFVISGNNSDDTYGIYSEFDKLTIQNCFFKNFSTGIAFNNMDKGRIINTTLNITHPTGNGINIYNNSYNNTIINTSVETDSTIALNIESNLNYLYNLTILSIHNTGIYLSGNDTTISKANITAMESNPIILNNCSKNNLSNIYAVSDVTVIILQSSANNNTFSNIELNADAIGLSIQYSNDNDFDNITIPTISKFAIELDTSHNNSFINANISSDTSYGAYVSSSSDNYFRNIYSYSQSASAFNLVTTDGNTFVNITAITENDVAFQAQDASNTDISNSTITTTSGTYALSFVTSPSINISNSVFDSNFTAVYIQKNSNSEISGINATSEYGYALRIDYGTNYTLKESYLNSNLNTTLYVDGVDIFNINNNTFDSGNNASTLVMILGASNNVTFYLNNFTYTTGGYINDSSLGKSHPTKRVYQTTNANIHGTEYVNGLFFGSSVYTFNPVIWRLNISSGILDESNISIANEYGFSQITYANSTDMIYAINQEGIYSVDIYALEITKIIDGSFGPSGSITNDGLFLYVISYDASSVITKYDIDSYELVATSEIMAGLFGHDIEYDEGFLYATGILSSGRIEKLYASNLSHISTTTVSDVQSFTDDMEIIGDYIYLGGEFNSTLVIVNKTDMSIYRKINLNNSITGFYNFYYDNNYLYAGSKETYPNGKIIIINITTLDFDVINIMDYSPNEILSDGNTLLYARWESRGVCTIENISLYYHLNNLNSTNNDGYAEGNIWHNVINNDVRIYSDGRQSTINGYYIGSKGSNYPYSSSTSQNKLIGNIADYAPITSLYNRNSGGGSSSEDVLKYPALNYNLDCLTNKLIITAKYNNEPISNLRITIFKDNPIFNEEIYTDSYGIAEFSIVLGEEYTLMSEMTNEYFSKTINAITTNECLILQSNESKDTGTSPNNNNNNNSSYLTEQENTSVSEQVYNNDAYSNNISGSNNSIKSNDSISGTSKNNYRVISIGIFILLLSVFLLFVFKFRREK